MPTKIAVLAAVKVIALTIILFAGFAVAGAVVQLPASQAGEPVDGAALALLGAHLLLPNPYMPHAVRVAHLAETVPSNVVFGGLVGWLLARRQRESHQKA